MAHLGLCLVSVWGKMLSKGLYYHATCLATAGELGAVSRRDPLPLPLHGPMPIMLFGLSVSRCSPTWIGPLREGRAGAMTAS
jgi:hypothetical protein